MAGEVFTSWDLVLGAPCAWSGLQDGSCLVAGPAACPGELIAERSGEPEPPFPDVG